MNEDEKVPVAEEPTKEPKKKNPHRFKPGNPGGPGRKKGGHNAITLAAKEWAEEFLHKNEDYRESLEERLKAGTAPLIEKYLWERVVGKPKEQLEITTTGPLFQLNNTEGPKED